MTVAGADDKRGPLSAVAACLDAERTRLLLAWQAARQQRREFSGKLRRCSRSGPAPLVTPDGLVHPASGGLCSTELSKLASFFRILIHSVVDPA